VVFNHDLDGSSEAVAFTETEAFHGAAGLSSEAGAPPATI